MHRHIWPAVGLLALLGCSDGTGPAGGGSEAEAARLEVIAREAGADRDFERANALMSAVAVIRAGGSLAKLVVSEGGATREYVGVVLELQPPASVVAMPGFEEFPTLRSLIAWSGDRADRVLQVSVFGDSADLGFEALPEANPRDPGSAEFYPVSFGFASLRRRGTREALWATSGFAVLRRTSLDGPCPRAPAGTATCERARFTARFKAGLTALPAFIEYPFEQPPAALTIGAETQPVRGARIEPSCPPGGCFRPGAPLFPGPG
jgi:hypothetical protein